MFQSNNIVSVGINERLDGWIDKWLARVDGWSVGRLVACLCAWLVERLFGWMRISIDGLQSMSLLFF